MSAHDGWSSASDIADRLGVSSQQAQEYYDAIQGFTSYDFVKMHQDQMNGVPNKNADLLEDFIDKAPTWAGGETMRGMQIADPQKFADMTTTGAVLDLNRGTASWTTSDEYARIYSGGTSGRSLIFVNESDTHKGATSIYNLSAFGVTDEPHSYELVASKDNRYRVKRTRTDPTGVTYVYVEEA